MVRTASIIVVLVMNIAPALAAPGAGPPRLEIGAPTGAKLARAGLVLRVRSELTRADLMLTFTTDASAEQEAAATFDLPHGARIVGMSFQTGDGSPMLARPMADAVAARAFDRIAHHFRKDPALLQLREEADARDRYSLRVYPLTASAPTTASIQIELPAARTLQLASAAPIEHVEVQIDGASEVFALTEPHAITLPEPVYTYDERPSRPLVTEALALFADDPARAPMLAGRVDVDLLVNPSATS
ncbi:MAG TPA: hypothetical protein VLB44_11680, partial [Kofleriaceae bacterium]|nr:hypothetical protein [Kofleriaceae bacterium]